MAKEDIQKSFETQPEWQTLALLKSFFSEQEENISKKENLDEIKAVFDLAETETAKQKDKILLYEYLIELCQKSLKDIIAIKQIKRVYKSAIDAGVHGLVDFMCLNLTDEELLYCLEKCKNFDTGKQSAKFYAEYGRILTQIKRKKISDVNLSEIKDVLEKSIQLNSKQPAAYLYLARFYKHFYDQITETPQQVNLQKAEEYFLMAKERGSKLAVDELRQFKKTQEPEISFDLMNASQNLEQFIDFLSVPVCSKDFSLLISGPTGSGKEIFAYKIMEALKCEFEFYTRFNSWTLPDDKRVEKLRTDERGNLRFYSAHKLCKILEENLNKGVIFFDADDELMKKNGDAFLTTNTLSMMQAVTDNNLPVIVVVKDDDNLAQDLKNAFTFRIRFTYMDAPQKEAAFKLFFGYDAPNYLRRLGGLVLEDFSRVKKQARIMNKLDSAENVLNVLEEEAKYKAGGTSSYLKPDTAFDYSLVNSDINLIELTEKLKENEQSAFSMLIYGPPGTGKSYFLRHLADQLGLTTLERTASDLLTAYSAGTVKNIADMFKQASEQKAMIIMDEVETFLQNREDSYSNYDNRIVNEFLTGIENFKYPFVATTNFYDKIDKAILRRFVFKTKFDYLTVEQNNKAFKHFFKMDPPEELKQIGGLTNGDYSTVKKKAIILGLMENRDELFEMLKEESQKKTKSTIKQLVEVKNFDKGFINTDIDLLDGYIKKIKKTGKKDFSFLLYGPSGTGKSLYLRYIASELGYEVIEKKASDLVGSLHGSTAKSIAKAFAEAKERNAFLIFDEIDGVLWNKNKLGGINVLFTDQVNEFLVQMENHDLPFAGTTNYLDNVEPAALRRFGIKALFDFLKPEQYDYVYEKTFGFKAKEDISYLKRLTPALFNLAYQKAELSDVLDDEDKVFDIFLNEVKIAGNRRKDEVQRNTFEEIEIKKIPLYTKPIAENYPDILKASVKIWDEVKTGHGSGFFISKDGFILTNKHVVKDNKSMIVELYSGREVPAEVLRTDDLDVALLKISDENLCTPLPLRLEEPNPGTTVFSMGNPDDKDQVLSKGNITRYTQNTKGYRRIEGDNFSYGGVSGGPLMDEFGNVLGLNVEGWMDRATAYTTNLGLAMQVPIIDALEILNIKIKER